jgi:uncharacterized metal-binding protein YceD (DUF177 family)
MNVKVSEIPEEGLSIEGLAEFPHPFEDPAWVLEDLSLRVEKDGADVLVRGRMRARVPQTCGRCLELFPFDVVARVDTRYCPRPARSEEVELTPDDLEVDFYVDDLLDVGRLLQTETELGLPMKPLCRPDCRGLCAVCGGNRNVTPCACEVRPPDPGLAALKELADRLRSSARTAR